MFISLKRGLEEKKVSQILTLGNEISTFLASGVEISLILCNASSGGVLIEPKSIN